VAGGGWREEVLLSSADLVARKSSYNIDVSVSKAQTPERKILCKYRDMKEI
jgi:hypothetical protein